MSGKIQRVEIRMMIEADDQREAFFKVASMVTAAIEAGYGISPLFAVSISNDDEPGTTVGTDETPKAEDVFGRIMSAPDVQ